MNLGARTNRCRKSPADRAQAGFTLAEVLAAMLFMAIVIPVAVQGLRVASLSGVVADRKGQAARIAERLLAESLTATNWNKSVQNGTLYEGDRTFRWTLRNENWNQDATMNAPHLLSVEVTYAVQDRDYMVRLYTLTPTTVQ
jgi:Tfp pilus assembly protein PilV